jgi:hypothetical protein
MSTVRDGFQLASEAGMPERTPDYLDLVFYVYNSRPDAVNAEPESP